MCCGLFEVRRTVHDGQTVLVPRQQLRTDEHRMPLPSDKPFPLQQHQPLRPLPQHVRSHVRDRHREVLGRLVQSGSERMSVPTILSCAMSELRHLRGYPIELHAKM